MRYLTKKSQTHGVRLLFDINFPNEITSIFEKRQTKRSIKHYDPKITVLRGFRGRGDVEWEGTLCLSKVEK